MPLWDPGSSPNYARAAGDIPPPATGGIRVQNEPPSLITLAQQGARVQTAEYAARLRDALIPTVANQIFYQRQSVRSPSDSYQVDVLRVDIGTAHTGIEGARDIVTLAEPVTDTEAVAYTAPAPVADDDSYSDDGGPSSTEVLLKIFTDKEREKERQENAASNLTPYTVAPSQPQVTQAAPVYIAPAPTYTPAPTYSYYAPTAAETETAEEQVLLALGYGIYT